MMMMNTLMIILMLMILIITHFSLCLCAESWVQEELSLEVIIIVKND